MACEQSGTISKTAFREALLRPTSIATNRDADVIFDIVDTDGSGTIELHELTEHLSKVGYHAEEIQTLFQRIRDDDSNDGSVSRAAFRRALLDDHADFYPTARVGGQQQLAPKWYFMNSVKHSLQPLGPIGRLSQRVERRIYNAVSKLFAIDTNEISKLGVPFALSYSILSHVNGALTFSVAWYLSCKRTGKSPLVPGQWRSLLASYSMIYGFMQFVRPIRLASAIGMSKISAKYLVITQNRLNCSRKVAIAVQYMMGWVIDGSLILFGVSLSSLLTGVPIF